MAENIQEAQMPNIVPEELKQFLIQLLEKKGGGKLPPEIQARALADMTSRFADYLIINCTRAMSPEQQDALEDKLEAGAKPEEITEFLKQEIDFAKVLEETSQEFEDTFLGKK